MKSGEWETVMTKRDPPCAAHTPRRTAYIASVTRIWGGGGGGGRTSKEYERYSLGTLTVTLSSTGRANVLIAGMFSAQGQFMAYIVYYSAEEYKGAAKNNKEDDLPNAL